MSDLWAAVVVDALGRKYYFTGAYEGMISRNISKASFAFNDETMAFDLGNLMIRFLNAVVSNGGKLKSVPLKKKN